jgi:hypothetical protein
MYTCAGKNTGKNVKRERSDVRGEDLRFMLCAFAGFVLLCVEFNKPIMGCFTQRCKAAKAQRLIQRLRIKVLP